MSDPLDPTWSREPGIVDVMNFWGELISRVHLPDPGQGWAWIVGLTIALFLLTVDRRRTRP